MIALSKKIATGLLAALFALAMTVPLTSFAQDDASSESAAAASADAADPQGAPETTTPDDETQQTTPAKNCQATIKYYENPTYDDPDMTAGPDGRYFLGEVVIDDLEEGQVIDTWDYVVDIPGLCFFDGWPSKLTVGPNPQDNVVTLTYFRLWNNDYTVNYYLMTGADLTADNWTDALAPDEVKFTKMGSQTFKNNPVNMLVDGDAFEYQLDGTYVIDTYPSELHVNVNPDRNVINVLYVPETSTLPDDEEIIEQPEGPSVPDSPDQGIGTPTLPDDTTMDRDDLIAILPDDYQIQEAPEQTDDSIEDDVSNNDESQETDGSLPDQPSAGKPSSVVQDFVGNRIPEGSLDVTDEMLQNPVDREQAQLVADAYRTGLKEGQSLPQTGDEMPVAALGILAAVAVVALVAAMVAMNRRSHKKS